MTRPFALPPDLAAALRRSMQDGNRLMALAAKAQREQMNWLYRQPATQGATHE